MKQLNDLEVKTLEMVLANHLECAAILGFKQDPGLWGLLGFLRNPDTVTTDEG